MTDHPQNYTLTRDEWLAINRALAGANLGLQRGAEQDKRLARLGRVRDAQETLSKVHQRGGVNDTASEN